MNENKNMDISDVIDTVKLYRFNMSMLSLSRDLQEQMIFIIDSVNGIYFRFYHLMMIMASFLFRYIINLFNIYTINNGCRLP